MQDAELKTSIKGSVLPASSTKVDLGDSPMHATIIDIHHNAADEELKRSADDCEFYEIEFPDEFSKHFQTFLPTKPEDLLHQLIDIFSYRYGKNVVLDQPIPASFAVGDVIKFKTEA